MSKKEIQKSLIIAENDLAVQAQNLADWFGKNREIPENHTGKCVLEKMYVSTLVKNISEAFDRIEILTGDLVEFERSLF